MPPSLRRILLGVVAVLTAALTTYGVTAEPGQPPVPPTPPNPTPTATATAAPGPGSTDEVGGPGCVAPPGMTGLISQDKTDHQVPWRRGGAPKVVVYFAAQNVSAEWMKNLQLGQAVWNRSPCLDVRVVSGPCPANQNCVTVHAFNKLPDGDDGNFDSKEKGGFTIGGDIQLLNSLSPGEKRNVAAHEMGHGLGLRHVTVKRDLMDPDTYEDVWEASELDYKNLAFLYGRQR